MLKKTDSKCHPMPYKEKQKNSGGEKMKRKMKTIATFLVKYLFRNKKKLAETNTENKTGVRKNEKKLSPKIEKKSEVI